MKLTTKQACDLLFRGKSNVPAAAKDCGLSTETMFEVFSTYAKEIPLTDDAWQGDVQLGWPWA
jgi:hypothetical protein